MCIASNNVPPAVSKIIKIDVNCKLIFFSAEILVQILRARDEKLFLKNYIINRIIFKLQKNSKKKYFQNLPFPAFVTCYLHS
jgi:hypothetical protein